MWNTINSNKKGVTSRFLSGNYFFHTSPKEQPKEVNRFVLVALLICLIIVLIGVITAFAQNNALVISGAYIKMNGGTGSTPIYMVVGQSNALGITRTSGHIISESDYNLVKWNQGTSNGSYVYPFGYSTTDYIPFTFNKTAGNANLAASTYGTATANLPLANTVTNMNPSGPTSDAGNMVVDRWWRLQVENGTTAPVADLTFSYRGSENTIASISCPADVIAAQYWNGTNWNAPALNPGTGCTSVSGIGTASATGVSVFTTTSSQPFILVKNTAILPVELLNFSAQCENENVVLKWSTASEKNNDYFTAERSSDGLNYQPIGIINGAGNSSTIHSYEFTDVDLPTAAATATFYYRLSQTDFDGTTKTFPPVSVSCSGNGGFSVSVSPNPVSDGTIYVEISGAKNENVLLVLLDVLGREVYSKMLIEQSSGYLFSINMKERLAPGVYFVTASAQDKYVSKKIIVAR